MNDVLSWAQGFFSARVHVHVKIREKRLDFPVDRMGPEDGIYNLWHYPNVGTKIKSIA